MTENNAMTFHQLDVKELTIYKVDVQRIIVGCRIEGFDCDSYMFLDYEKAMDFAFNLAKKYVVEHEKMPNEYYKNKKNKKYNDEDVNKLVKSESYTWRVDDDCWNEYSIVVYTSKLEFDKDIIHQTCLTD